MKETFIIKSKNVFDGLHKRPIPMAIAINDKRIEKILPWNYQEYDGRPGNPYKDYISWEVHDYGSQYIQYSFLDAHTHFFSGAIDASEYVCSDLGECTSQEECAEKIRKFAENHPEQKRIRGTGWFIGNWSEDTLPDKRSLDRAVPDRPVYLQCADAHSYWLNSKALEEAQIHPIPEMTNGIVGTFENGELSGMLLEPAACAPAEIKFMDFTDEEMYRIFENFQNILAENGIGAVSEMFADDYTEEAYQRYDLVKKLDQAGKMKAYVFNFTKLFGYTDFTPYFKMKQYFNSPHFQIAGVKGFIDGVTETYTGLLLEPYSDRPETCGENLPLWPQDKMQEEIIAANKAGIPVRLHCIADGSVRMALDMYEKALQVNGPSDIHNTIEHIENIHPDDLKRFALLGVIPSMQPYHLVLAKNNNIRRLGKERIKLEWPFHSVLEAGGELAIGTDYPVVSLNPFATIYAAVARKDDQTKKETGFNPWEKISLADTLIGYTKTAAKVYGMEREMGTIEEGKYANIIVLSQNLFEIEEDRILETKVMVNYFEGEKIWERADM